MPNQFINMVNTVLSRITNKFSINSISPADVGNTNVDILSLCLLVQLADPAQTYAANQRVRDSSYNVYISRLNDVSGDVTNTTNWVKVAGPGTSSGAQVFTATITADGTTQFATITHGLNKYGVIASISQSADTAGNSPYTPRGLDGITFPTANTAVLDINRYDNIFGYRYQLAFV